jgi:hypothetical protein
VSSRISAKEARGGGSFEVGHISLGELLGVQEEEREQKRGNEGREDGERRWGEREKGDEPRSCWQPTITPSHTCGGL